MPRSPSSPAITRVLLATLAVSLNSCDTNDATVIGQSVVGSYVATTYTYANFFSSCQTGDALSRGGFYEMKLGASGEASSSYRWDNDNDVTRQSGFYTTVDDTLVVSYREGDYEFSQRWKISLPELHHLYSTNLPMLCQPEITVRKGP